MKIYCGGVEFEEISNFKSLASSLENDCCRLEVLCSALNCLSVGDFVGLEGIVTDTISTAWNIPKQASKIGKKAYGAANKQYLGAKNRWKTHYKPMIIKIIKEMGAVLQGMYAKFSKLGKRYTELGIKVDQIRKYNLNRIGTLPSGIKLRLHDFEAHVLKGYITIIADYEEFVDSLFSTMNNKSNPEDIIALIRRNDHKRIEATSKDVSNLVGSINQYGDISIPWAVFKTERYNSMFRSIINRKPSKEDLKGSLSDFVKRSILSKEVEYVLDVDDGKNLTKLATGYLSVVSSILNNKVLEDALNKGGRSVKDATKKAVEELDKVSEAGMNVKPEVESKSDEDEEEAKKDPNARTDVGDPMSVAVDAYIQNVNVLITKTSTAYTGIVRGTLSAMFDIIGETEFLVKIIEDSSGKGE